MKRQKTLKNFCPTVVLENIGESEFPNALIKSCGNLACGVNLIGNYRILEKERLAFEEFVESPRRLIMKRFIGRVTLGLGAISLDENRPTTAIIQPAFFYSNATNPEVDLAFERFGWRIAGCLAYNGEANGKPQVNVIGGMKYLYLGPANIIGARAITYVLPEYNLDNNMRQEVFAELDGNVRTDKKSKGTSVGDILMLRSIRGAIEKQTVRNAREYSEKRWTGFGNVVRNGEELIYQPR